MDRVECLDLVARSIYHTHWARQEANPDLQSTLPSFDNASDEVREWVRQQAESVVAALEAAGALRLSALRMVRRA